MAEQNVQEQISALKSHLNGLIEKSTTDLQSKVSDKVDAQIKAEIQKTMDSLKELQKPMEQRLDSFEAEIQKAMESNQGKREKGFGEMLKEAFQEESVQKALRERRGSIELDKFDARKAVGPMTPSASLTGEVIPADYRPGIIELVQRRTHVRELLGAGGTSSDVYRFVQETAGEGGAGMTAPGATKNQIDFDLAAVSAPVKKVTGFAVVADELLEDIVGLSSFLSNRLTKELRKVEDAQFLFGSGAGDNLTGLDQGAATFAAFKADPNATIIDLVVDAATQLEGADYMANGVLLSPRDYFSILTAKDVDGQYVKTDLISQENGQLFIAGIPIFRSTAVPVNEYFIGDWVSGAEIRDRIGLNVRFYEQDSDNRRKNLVTVVAEERLAFPIYYPESFIYGDVSTDIAKIKNFT